MFIFIAPSIIDIIFRCFLELLVNKGRIFSMDQCNTTFVANFRGLSILYIYTLHCELPQINSLGLVFTNNVT